MWALFIQTIDGDLPFIIWFADWSVCDQTRQLLSLWLHQLGAQVEASFCHYTSASTLLNLPR